MSKIKDVLNLEGIPCPQRYMQEKFGKKGDSRGLKYWSMQSVKWILKNPIYTGDLVQQRVTTVSYKNHKRIYRDESDFLVIKNTHEPIIDRETFERIQEMLRSVSQGRKTKRSGFVHALSGLMFCEDCGGKMRMSRSVTNGKVYCSFECGDHNRLGKAYCFSHHINAKDIEEVILADIRSKIDMVIADEDAVRNAFLERSEKLSQEKIKSIQNELKKKSKRLADLDGLLENAYVDKVKGKIPEDICVMLITRYIDEKKTLTADIETLNESLAKSNQVVADVDEFIAKIKRYLNVNELTRAMSLELIERVIIGATPKDKNTPRKIQIVYKVDLV